CMCSPFRLLLSKQRRWARHHGHCAGKTQSPISVHSSRTIPLHMPAVDMIGYHNVLPYPLKMINNGHTVSITIPKLSDAEQDNGEFMPYVRGAKLPGEFEVEGIHFHWGDKNNRGAEHVVNDIRYTMEMHIDCANRNKKYATLAALDYVDGAAVLGFFFNLDEDESTGLTTICRHLHLIPEAGNEVSLNVTFSLASLIHGVDIDKFYTYKGSLTTPPCSEAVTWVLYPDPIPISPKQVFHIVIISRFRQLSDSQEGALVDNYRQLQPLGNRRIFMRDGNTHHTQISKLVNEVDYKKWDWFH
ncbi:hypothetical protein DOY81_013231, partial [Sarcophaga bullata]